MVYTNAQTAVELVMIFLTEITSRYYPQWRQAGRRMRRKEGVPPRKDLETLTWQVGNNL